MSTAFLKCNLLRDDASTEEHHGDESGGVADGLMVKSEEIYWLCRLQQGFKSNAAGSHRRIPWEMV